MTDAEPAPALAALPPELASLVLPSRRHPGAPPATDTGARWQRFCERARAADMLVAESSAPDYGDAVDEALARIDSGQRTGSQASDAVLLVVERELARQHEDDDNGSIIDAMVKDKGLLYAFEVLLLAQRAYAQNDYSFRGDTYGIRDAMAASGYPNYRIYNACELALRAHLAHAGVEIWEQCVQAARRAAPALRNSRLPLLAALLPDAPQLADDLALMLTPTPTANGPEWHANYSWLILYASAPQARQALRLWPRSADNSAYQFHGKDWSVATALQDRGTDAFEALSDGASGKVGSQALACIGTVQSMTALARAAASESLFDNLCAAGQRWPDAAMTALAELIGKDHCGPLRARQALAAIVAQHAGRVPALLPSVSAPARKVLSAAAASYLGAYDYASAGELPPVLEDDPLRLHPAKIGKLPAFWTPQAWTRPLLAANGKALPDTALDAIGVMLRFPHADGVYPGVTQLKQACTPGSLADFAWELFRAWVEDGARPKEAWAFYALGLLGDDDSARRLTPLIRAWPGEQLHARAATGLDVLALIGNDTAMMHLNGIAQKLKFKGLQERARDKINEIAEARGLSTDELEDRLAPDLGLDEQGTALLDFGPRQFRVGFDETLKPFVRDDTGARLSDLPKPKKTDDATLSKQAMERFKLLKKDARTIAAQQVLRLESAMCTQRRWHPHDFRAFLATHPLLRHLVQRLVWGMYSTEGDRLLACFRATADGAFTDAGDDAIDLPDGDSVRIGVPHALDLAPGDATAFGQLFADYELLQPFAQIGRDTHHLEAGESGEHAMRRWEGRSVTTGALLGLLNRGWRRGEAQDGGSILDFRKLLGGGAMASLGIGPGIVVSMMREGEVQTLDPVMVGRVGQWDNIDTSLALGTLPAVVVSELIRDLQSLGA